MHTTKIQPPQEKKVVSLLLLLLLQSRSCRNLILICWQCGNNSLSRSLSLSLRRRKKNKQGLRSTSLSDELEPKEKKRPKLGRKWNSDSSSRRGRCWNKAPQHDNKKAVCRRLRPSFPAFIMLSLLLYPSRSFAHTHTQTFVWYYRAQMKQRYIPDQTFRTLLQKPSHDVPWTA